MSEHASKEPSSSTSIWCCRLIRRIVAVANNPRSRVSGAFEKARGMRVGVPDCSSPAAFTP